MILRNCPREKELRALVARGDWALAADPDLRAHIAACRSCSDLVLVSETFRSARAASTATARLVSPGILWWRAQLRRRNAVIEQLSRPLIGAEIFALAFTLLAGVGFVVFESMRNESWRSWIEQLPQSAALPWNNLLASASADPNWSWMSLLPAAATLILLGGIAVYMAADRQ